VELLQIRNRDHAFIQNDGQRPLLLQRGQAAQVVGRHRLFQNVHPSVAEFRRYRQSRIGVIAAVAIGPQEALRRQSPYFFGEREVELRVWRHLDIEIAIAALAAPPPLAVPFPRWP
jgi:hypothetical protein